jgi:hypothetical protein
MIPTTIIKEEFIHFLWRHKLVPNQMFTVDGRKIEVLEFGLHNSNSGPDFLNGKIRLDNTIWAGNIEMHVRSRDWMRHGHHEDRAYDNVILHVVYEHDGDIYIQDRNIPTVALKGAIPHVYFERYSKLMDSKKTIPCTPFIDSIPPIHIDMWKHALTVERLEKKSHLIQSIYTSSNNNWEETFYILLSKYFGSTVNSEPMELLARNLSLNIIYKNQHSSFAIDALLFGVAGMLQTDYQDAYFADLKNEWGFLSKKYDLKSIHPTIWKFGRLRPPNFPTIRIAQLSSILARYHGIFNKVLHADSYLGIRQLFIGHPNPYWDNHYRFGTEAEHSSKDVASGFIDILIINVVAPMLFHYGKHTADNSTIERSIDLISHIKSENNSVIKQWASLGLKSKTAYDSQALIQLKKQYCDELRCLECKIGQEIVGNKGHHKVIEYKS